MSLLHLLPLQTGHARQHNEWESVQPHGEHVGASGKAVRLPQASARATAESHLVLAPVYLFIFQQTLKSRKKDNTSTPGGI